MSHSFLDANIPELISKLTIEEKISLLGAPNWWNTTRVERLGIPSVRMSDGPNGVRGSSHFASTPAQCLPCATSLASTFDPELIHNVGVFLAEEAKLKSSVILLAPTCNMQRSPLGGRAFESFSEDPHLSGVMASAYVKGLQSKNVAATIKHFVCNDQEHERTAAESVLSERALREIYLYPFMLAQKDAKPWAYMTSYGRLNGIHCAESRELMQGILRDEWKFEGIIMSDWHGTYSTDLAINAGMELEMPGPPRWRTENLIKHCLTSQKIFMETINERIYNLLTFIQRQARLNPEVVYGDGEERTRPDSPGTRKFCRKLAADGIVLLKNQGEVLPISPKKYKKIAVIGPNAKDRVISGGGSAFLKASYVITPFDGIKEGAANDLEIDYTVGCYAHKYLPTLEHCLVTGHNEPGWLCTFYNHNADGSLTEPIASYVLQDTRVKLNDFLPEGLTPTWSIKLTGKLTVEQSMSFELGLTVAGRAKLWIDGKMTIDNWTKQTPGDFFYGQGTIEEKATIDLKGGESVDVLVEYTNTAPSSGENGGNSAQPALMRGVRLGGCEKINPEAAIKAAETLASQSDLVVFVGGLTSEWESEGFDRPTLDLPGRQNEVITRVAAANPRTVVVTQAGSATSMPWVDSVAGIIQAWYLGNETGNAIADILYGIVNPSGRLPLTLPKRLEDIAAYPNLRSEHGKIHYHEDIFMGYKHFQAKGVQPLFHFGHGLSYTRFSLSGLTIKNASKGDSVATEVSVTVKNEGSVSGSEVVQVYISYPDNGITHPRLQLRGFAKARNVAPGSSSKVTIPLDKYAVSYWDNNKHCWLVVAGEYGVHVGFSCDDIVLEEKLKISEAFAWTGL
ncbi:glycoside hydrolase family 3 protein [Moniliophthora roreri MCA 2997]|uniref:beta-glucosidase n=2 Tax=Moniliophthora roreri TaxID=221103 RepID=V2Y9P8_MONRO|nr:glycoside hydrolase family 3 protein [Moniliophthora roreri MCA 2997]KAI3610475.1 glycoside hydrolase family 3 protein [Moniliophthora roreri]